MKTLRFAAFSLLLSVGLIACARASGSGDDADTAGLGGSGGEGGEAGEGGQAGGAQAGKGGKGGEAAGGEAGQGGEGGEAGAGGEAGGEAGASGAAGSAGSGGASGMAGVGGAAGAAGAGGGLPPCDNTPIINELMTFRQTDGMPLEEAYEFVELLSPATNTCTIALGEYKLLVDGAVVWQGLAAAKLSKGKRYVIAGQTYSSENSSVVDASVMGVAAAFPKDGGCLELQHDGTTVDALCYGTGSGGEGKAAPAPPSAQSIARTPDGTDTNDNASDFKVATPTPKAAN